MAAMAPSHSAPAPVSIPDTTHAIIETCNHDAPPGTSPAESEKTVIARPASRLRKMVARPGTGAAVFSTDGGRLPRRAVPIPPPPVIVRSDKFHGVLDSANYWRKKCPEFYHCFFPNQRWTITDLWDDNDIHIESPGFLEEVLQFIVRDNAAGATNFARDWCQRSHEKMDKLGAADVSHLHNADDPFAILDEFFTEGEQRECPQQFLLYVLGILRQAMRSYLEKYRPQQNGGSAEASAKDAPGAAPDVNRRSSMSVRQVSAFPGSPFILPGSVQSMPNGPLVRQPSYPQPQLSRQLLNEGSAVPMGHDLLIQGQFVGQPRYANRTGRSGSNPYAPQPQMYRPSENIRMSSGEHLRHPSGPLPNSHRFGRPMPIGPGMLNPLHHGGPPPTNTSITSPRMHPSQMQYPQMLPRLAMFSPQGPLPPPPNDVAFQQFEPDFESRTGPFMDIGNSIHYSQVRDPGGRGLQRRSSQSVRPSGLFNPYGAERPDKAGFATTGPKKGGRSFSNNVGRSRKSSAGMFDRSHHGAYPSEYPENALTHTSSEFNEGPQLRHYSASFTADLDITNDKESGCAFNFIGPKNNTVRQLHLKNLPNDIQGSDIQDMFKAETGVLPAGSEVKYKTESNEPLHAFVFFNTTDEARKALELKNRMIRGKEVHISVARRYFQLSFPSQQRPRGTHQELNRSADGTSKKTTNPIQYSLQDARSDLHQVNKKHQPDHPATRGSPEARKTKRTIPVRKGHLQRDVQHNDDVEIGGSSINLSPVTTSDGSSMKHDSTAHSPYVSDSEAVVIKKNVKEKRNSIGKALALVADTKGSVPEDAHPDGSEAHLTPRNDSILLDPVSISETIPADSQGPLLCSPTKVALPRPAEQVQKVTQEKKTDIKSNLDDLQVKGIAAVALPRDDIPSDDDQKHDLSFHSAQESQSDSNKEAQADISTSATTVTEETPIETALKNPQDSVQHPGDVHPDEGHVIVKPDVTLPQTQQATAVGQPSAENIKKHGAKQIESLNPYSKSSRAQQKKEKQAKKKEKKKGKAEMMAKTRANTEDKPISGRENEGTDKNGPGAAVMGLQIEKIGNDKGKHSRRASTNVMSQNSETQQSVADQGPEKVVLDQVDEGLPIVQSHEKNQSNAKLAENHAITSTQLTAPKSDRDRLPEAKKKFKAAPAKIAVPNLELLNQKSPLSSTATPPHTAFFSVLSSTSEKEGSTMGNLNEAIHAHQEVHGGPAMTAPHDPATVASSSTLREPSPSPMSLSPTAKEFHTPLQTPSTLDMEPSDLAKKKKNNKKKGGKKKPASTVGISEAPEEPFHDQLVQIANMQSALRDSDAAEKGVLEATKEDKGPKGLIRQVQAYMKEKASSYARVPESTWSKDNRKGVEKMTPAESAQIVNGYALPVSRGMKYYAKKCVIPSESPEEAAKVPDSGE